MLTPSPPPSSSASSSPRRLLYRRRRPPRSTFFSSGAKGGARLPILGARAARELHSVKASPLVRECVPEAVGRVVTSLRQDRDPLVDQLLDALPVPLQDLRSEGVAAPADAGRAAAVPPRPAVKLLHPAPGLDVGRQAAADRATSFHCEMNSEFDELQQNLEAKTAVAEDATVRM